MSGPAAAVIVGVLVAYGALLFGIGLWARRGSGDIAGYYVAGRQLPSWVIAFSSNATGESAWLLLGLTGMGYAVGVHALWVVLGEVLGVALSWAVVALPFKTFADRYDCVTVPDYLERRFRDRRRLFRLLGLVIIGSMVATYVAAQFTAMGKAFHSFVGTSYGAGVLIGAAVILFYTTVGGFKAVAYTDVLQGVLMFGSLAILPVVGFVAAGGWPAVFANLHAQDPALLGPMGGAGFTPAGLASAGGFVAVGLAFLGAPQLLARFISARSRGEIVKGSLIAVICIIVFDLGAVFTGMAGRALYPALADPETVLPTMASNLFPAVFTGLVLVVVLAASMSTVDSLLILASSAVVRDVMQMVLRVRMSEGRLALWGKVTTLVIGVAGVTFALGQPRVIFWFVLFAWSGLAAAFTPVVLLSLFWKRATLAGAVAGMIAGFATTVLWVAVWKTGFYDLYEMIPGFLAGFAATVGVSLVTRAPAGASEEFDDVWLDVRRFRPGIEAART